MASNIRVTLEVDSREFLAGVKQAETATRSFAQTSQQNLRSTEQGFTRITATAETLRERLLGLKTALLGLGFGALANNALQFAGSIKDLSDSSGIAIRDLTALANALTTSGVAAEKLPEFITRFSNSLEDAAGNAGRSLFAFEQMGVSLEDIGRTSTADLLIQTLEGLVAMGPGVERTARQVELFGKAGRTLDPEGLLNSFRAIRTSTEQYSAGLRAAAELSDQLGLAAQRLNIAFAAAFERPIAALSELLSGFNQSQRAMETVIVTLQAFGAVLAAIAGGAALLGIVRLGAYIATAFSGAAAALTTFGATAGATMGIIARFTAVGRALSIIAAAGFGLYAAANIFEDFASTAVNALARVVEYIGEVQAGLLNIPTQSLAAALRLIPESIRPEWLSSIAEFFGENGLGTPIQLLVNRARAAREEFERLQEISRAQRRAGTEIEVVAQAEEPQGADISGALRARQQQRDSIARITEAFADQNRQVLERIQLETALVGISSDFAELERASLELSERRNSAIDQLTERLRNLRQEEAFLIPVIEAQIAAIREQHAAQDEQLRNAIRGRQAAEAADRIAIETARGAAELEQQRASLLGYSLTALERFNAAQAAGDFRNRTQEEIDLLREQAVRLDGVTASIQAMITQRQTEQQLLDLQTQFLGRQYTALERLEQLRAQNPEQFARRTEAENQALQRQAELIDQTTQRLRAQAFARDLTRQGEDFAQNLRDQMRMDTAFSETRRRSIQVEIDLQRQLQSVVREIQDRYGDEAQLSEERRQARQTEIDSAIQGFQRLRAEQQQLVAADQAQRETFGFGWDQAFGRYAAAARDRAQEAQTYFNTFTRGVEDAIVRFVQTGKLNFKDLANSLIAEFARIQTRRMLAGLLDLGSGLFTSGGETIPGRSLGGPVLAGSPYIVGERGPELFMPRTAGNIIPNNRLNTVQSQPQTTQVVYNIQAVDALSFRQMVARDPEFLYAVTERGRSSLPTRR